MYCKECGQAIPEKARFCPKCGQAIAPGPEEISRKQQTASIPTSEEVDSISRLLEIPEEKGRFDRTAPPVISPLTIFFAIIGLVLILILLNPWHAGQEKPADFQGTRGASPTLLIPESLVE